VSNTCSHRCRTDERKLSQSRPSLVSLFDELGAPLLSCFRREVKTRDEAADLCSKTWTRVVASRSRDPRVDAEHTAFVYSTARNLLGDWCRRGLTEQARPSRNWGSRRCGWRTTASAT
jgi:DNA-directed RNA polymerase specialized sigma24 family protein